MYSRANSSPMLELMPQVRAMRPQCATNLGSEILNDGMAETLRGSGVPERIPPWKSFNGVRAPA